MRKEKELPQRKSTRWKNFDYSSSGAYFITICTENRRQVLSRVVGGDIPDAPKNIAICTENRRQISSRIVGGDVPDAPKNVELLPYGKMAEKNIKQLNDFYDNVRVDRYVIMPNHIHMMLVVLQNGVSRTSPPTKQHATVSQFVSTFKRFCNKEYGGNIWQRYCNDHIIRNRKDYEEHIKYICENPMRWYYDELYAKE